MNNVAQLYPKGRNHYCGPANVIGLADSDGLIPVRLQEFEEKLEVSVRIAAPLVGALDVGDEVLVTGDVYGDVYLIGVFAANDAHQKAKNMDKLDIGKGAYALVGADSETSALKLFNKRNELLIEYDPESEKARINIECGDLEFITQNGDIVLNSANNIQLKGQNIELAGQSGIQLGVMDRLGQLTSSFSLGACQASLSSTKLRLTAKLGELQLKETRLVGTKFRGTLQDSQVIVDRLSTVANTVTEKAQNVYRSVEQLTQLKTGRMRTLVASTFHLKSKKTMMKSEEDFKVNADKIHLG